jgi:hypothetical protein
MPSPLPLPPLLPLQRHLSSFDYFDHTILILLTHAHPCINESPCAGSVCDEWKAGAIEIHEQPEKSEYTMGKKGE